MNDQQRAAMQMALEALEVSTDWDVGARGKQLQSMKAITALREALAEQAEQRSDSERMEQDHFADTGNMVFSKPSVFDGICCGCSKKAADGWALYCVECWEKSNGDPFAASGKPIDHIPDATKMVAPEGYALISIEALKAWGKYDEVRSACRFPAEPVHQSWCNTVVSLSPNPVKCNCKDDHVEQSLTMVAEPAIPEWVDVDDYEEPVKQEPVAYTNKEQLGYLKDERYKAMPMAMWAAPFAESVNVPLYIAPPSVEAAIEATKEKATKVCDDLYKHDRKESGYDEGWNDALGVAEQAIRSMK
jgi:hypothetical protein